LIQKLKKHINKNLPFLTESKLLIAISGGLDSVVLSHLCKTLDLNFALAHCNFNLRGDESDSDENFVLNLAEEFNVEIFIKSFDTNSFAKKYKISTQMAARELRYDWFEELSDQLNFDYILTAHHADDNLETFLINLSRGTGLDGLIGIPEENINIVRPLLTFSREDIESYAKANHIKWREDSSNASTKYLRNTIRHEVIPKLKEINPQLLQNFENTQSYLNDSKHIIEDAVAQIQRKVVSIEDSLIKINIKKLLKLSHTKAYLYELLKDFNFNEWNDVYDLLDAQSGKQIFSKTHRLIKDRDYLLLEEINNDAILNESEESINIVESDKQFQTHLGILFFDNIDKKSANIDGIQHLQSCIYVDKDLLKFPLSVRQWQKGDYFYPFGMQGKKKLSKFFKDEKFSLIEKENILLLCSGDDIVWIINNRADNRFKVDKNTNEVLKISITTN